MKHFRWSVVSALLSATILLSACTDFEQRQDAVRERYHSYAGPPIEEFTWLGRYYSWAPLGNDELVVFTTPFDAYLIKVLPPCIDLPFAGVIGLTSTGRTVTSRFDFVLVRDRAETGIDRHFPCHISEIRKVDYQRMFHDIRDHGPLQGAPRNPAPPPTQAQNDRVN